MRPAPTPRSGHFLLAAARRLGRELARVRAGEDQPSPTQFRRAVRDVIRRCIFGVDLNPLAVDLCKLALWIEGHAAGLPLSFIDHHIRHGNSLVGATRELVEAGIPDDAYKAVSGDDKATASSLKKRNRQERELFARQGMVQHDLFAATSAPGDDLAAALRALDEAGDDSVPAVRARAARYAALRGTAAAERARFDLWTAAFFQPLTPANAAYVPTSQDLIDFDPAGAKALMAAPLAAAVGFFHWELEFPQVFGEGGGFDVVLGNPPWERIKLQEQEHFVDVPAIAGAANKAARDKAIAAWRGGDERQRARIALFDAARYRAEAESRFVRASGRFPLTAVGDVNTYALFAEHARRMLATTGRTGIIVPMGIATDDTTKIFFNDLMQSEALVQIVGFENEEFIFPEVHNQFKFCQIVISGKNMVKGPTVFSLFCRNVSNIQQIERKYLLTSNDIQLFNPNTNNCPVFRSGIDAKLAKKIYESNPVLKNERTGKRTWLLSFNTMLHMANDSSLFQQFSAAGSVPLYEAKMIWHYNHRFATLIGRGEGAGRPSRKYDGWYGVNYSNPEESVISQYGVLKQEVEQRVGQRWRSDWFIGFRDVANPINERTATFAILPRVAVGHTMPLIFTEQHSLAMICCLLSSLNSIPFDYLARQKITINHLTYGVFYQLPVLPPDRFTPEDIAFIVPRVVELVYTAWDIKAFAEDVWAEGDEALRAELLRRNAECNAGADPALFSPRDGFALPPFRWDEGRRAVARAELDARIARLYGLTRDELRYILDPHDVYGTEFPGETFRVLKEKELKLYGEFRTRRLVLEAWDAEEGER